MVWTMEAQNSKICRTNGKARASVSYGFSLMQLQELEQQSLIYNYIQAGIPVPIYLILPIWKSFPTSISHQFYHNHHSVLDYNLKNSKDSEPGRCRRTDGRKWRCTKPVVQGHNYCHAHAHRGRLPTQKSRATTTTATSTTATAKEADNKIC